MTREVDAYLQPFLDAGGFSGAVLMAKGVFLDRLFWATLIFQIDAEGKVTGFVWRDTKDYAAVRVK